MKDKLNSKWTMKDIAQQYKKENPDWSWKRCWKKARIIYKELNKLNNQLWKSNKSFFENNIPFSFYDIKDDEFNDTYWDRKSH